MKIKTSELTGAALDWAVAKCEGFLEEEDVFGTMLSRVVVCDKTYVDRVVVRLNPRPEMYYDPEYNPSTNWEFAGPIIEGKRLSLTPRDYGWDALVHERLFEEDGSDFFMKGPTPLVAAMRCFVASRLGDEVDVPEELT